MPSTHDDSSGSGSFSTPRSTPPGIPGNAGGRPDSRAGQGGASTDRWLGVFMVDCMVAAGIDRDTASRAAADMQPAIVAAFSTLARLDQGGFVIDTNGGSWT